jgi:hypothetical protein
MVTLSNQQLSKVQISDKNVKYFTTKIIQITRTNIGLIFAEGQSRGWHKLLLLWSVSGFGLSPIGHTSAQVVQYFSISSEAA